MPDDGVQARARPAAQRRRRHLRSGQERRRPISPMRSMCWRATAWRRSAICATSPTPSSTRWRRRSPRRRSPPRSPWSATAPAPSASMRRRSRRLRRAAARSRRPRGLRLDLARRRGAGGAREPKAARRARRCRPRCSASRPPARRCVPTSTQEDAWLLLAASAMAKDAGKISLDVGGEAMTAPALPHHPRRRSEGAAAHHQHRRGRRSRRRHRHRRAGHARAGGRERLQDRAADLHARRRPGRSRRRSSRTRGSSWC